MTVNRKAHTSADAERASAFHDFLLFFHLRAFDQEGLEWGDDEAQVGCPFLQALCCATGCQGPDRMVHRVESARCFFGCLAEQLKMLRVIPKCVVVDGLRAQLSTAAFDRERHSLNRLISRRPRKRRFADWLHDACREKRSLWFRRASPHVSIGEESLAMTSGAIVPRV